MKRLIVLILLFQVSCNTTRELDVQGHRGYRGLYPENSLIGFEKAIELGVSTLELDVVISKDSMVLVSHEPYMNHEIALDLNGQTISLAQEKSYNLYTMTFDSISKYDCGTKIHPRFPNQNKFMVSKPLLMEVIQLAEKKSKNNILYNIEIKSQPEYDEIYTPDIDVFVSLVMEVVASEGISDRTVLQSFDTRTLEVVKSQYPKIYIALLVDENESISEKLSELTFEPQIISPYFKLINKNLVEKYQGFGYKIIPWTVNSVDDIVSVIDFGVDGIISDYPDRVLSIIRNN